MHWCDPSQAPNGIQTLVPCMRGGRLTNEAIPPLMHCCCKFQGERGYFLGHFTDFAVLEIVEKGGYFVNNVSEIIK